MPCVGASGREGKVGARVCRGNDIKHGLTVPQKTFVGQSCPGGRFDSITHCDACPCQSGPGSQAKAKDLIAIGLNKAKPEKSDLATFLATFKNSTTQRFLRI